MFGIVFVHYQIPERRLREHIEWNDQLYRQFGARVFVVADRNYLKTIPEGQDYAQCVIYPKPMPVFSLAATKNCGIEAALRAGCDRIAATDTDVAWTQEALRLCSCCAARELIVPIYRMSLDFATRDEIGHPDYGCGGTIAMTAENWRRVQYDERYEGYGGEDGRLQRDAAAAGIQRRRDCFVHHIAHDPTACQQNVPGAGRADCWNRDTINPDNWQTNKLLYNA